MKIKSYEELDFTDDFMFCKVLTADPDLTRRLLELILGLRIRKVVFPEAQKTIEITSDGRGIRLDVYVMDEQNTVYDVEMQTTRQPDLAKRMRYYQGMIDLQLISRGSAFRDLKKSVVIFICLDDPFGAGRHIYTFANRCAEDPSLCLGDEAYKVIVNARGTMDDVSGELKEFLAYIRGGAPRGELTRRIDSAVAAARTQEEWRTEYMTLLMRDEQMRNEGRAQGRAEGRAEERASMVGDIRGLVRDGLLTLQQAIDRFSLTEEEAAKLKG